MKKLLNAFLSSLVALSCSNDINRDEHFIPIKFRGEGAYLNSNWMGENHILVFYKRTGLENNLDIYLAVNNRDTLYSTKRPSLMLIDNNGDYDVDLILRYKINNRYDTTKLNRMNNFNLRDNHSIKMFLDTL